MIQVRLQMPHESDISTQQIWHVCDLVTVNRTLIMGTSDIVNGVQAFMGPSDHTGPDK